jgi:hypothetical protein
MFLCSCSNNSNNVKDSDRPLKAAYEYFDQLSEDEFHFVELDHKLNTAKGKNNPDDISKYTKEFEVSQASCIKKMEEKFPEGSVKIPFEQIQGNDTLTVKSVYVSGYSFPWGTATTICFYFTVEYDIHKKDLWFIPISLKFVDAEDDIINFLHLPANSSGKSRCLVRTQFTFRDLKKLVINQ